MQRTVISLMLALIFITCSGLAPRQLAQATDSQPEVVVTLTPALLPSGFNTSVIGAGQIHTCVLTSGGGLKCWGENFDGQLGDGTNTNRRTAVPVVGLESGVSAVALGAYHTCALTSSGGVKCWGNNEYGQLGDGTLTASNTPVDVVGLTSRVSAIAAGQFHTCALTTRGGVRCWGYNGTGQLGTGSLTDSLAPVDVIGLGSGVRAISTSSYHTCALSTAGGLKCWGHNEYGQLGDGTTTNKLAPVNVTGLSSGVSDLTAGDGHTCAVVAGSGAKCWGRNQYGQLGDNTTTNRLTPVYVSGLNSGVIAVGAGYDHACALTFAGGVKCWGRNNNGQLGDGTTMDKHSPVDVTGLAAGMSALSVGVNYNCALSLTGQARCWGDNNFAQLGDGTLIDKLSPVPVTGLESGVSAIAQRGYHTCALMVSGGVKCWGFNYSGQLGDGTTTHRFTPVDVSTLSRGVKAIGAGEAHNCAVTSAGGVKCWGENSSGQLGDGTTTTSSLPVNVSGLTSGVSALAAGLNHTCALTTGGGVKCWGGNTYGQLGDGTNIRRLTPVDVSGLTSGVISITAGVWHTCAVTSVGSVKCWGANLYGQLGDGTTTNKTLPVNVSGLASGFAAVIGGAHHTCALTVNGGLKCWGRNTNGQLGDNSTTNRLTPVSVSGLSSGVIGSEAGYEHTCAVMITGSAKCWGSNASAQLGDGTTADRHTPVTVAGFFTGAYGIDGGTEHTCVLTSGGGVKCWGYNAYGEVGDGTQFMRTTYVQVSGLRSLSMVVLSPQANPTLFGQPASLIASVIYPVGLPGGTVQFMVNGVNIGSPVSLTSASAASPPINNLPPGAHLVTAIYSGDASHEPAQAAGVVLIVEGTSIYLPMVRK